MCGRYTITTDAKQLAERFQVATIPTELLARYNAAPAQQLPVLTNQGEWKIQLFRWGLVPHWAEDVAIGSRMINARAETLAEKPAFREPLRKRRCLVLADSFFEWQKTPAGKVPMRIMLRSEAPFAFAGLWSTWQAPGGEPLHTFTIITTSANELVAPIHNRMPVLLAPQDEQRWLDNEASVEDWQALLQPYPAELMKAYPVSKRVNSPSNDVPEIINSA